MTATSRLRLLPWSSPDGRPCYLAAASGSSRLSRRADEIEAVQLTMGAELLGHARSLLGNRKADIGEVRFLAERLCESLSDVLRVAESRGARLPVDGDSQTDPEGGADDGSASSSGRETS
ncbi:hypothetical protein [Streptomyces sp. NPDC097640]|uniref:hypothetical protein n=1 Tax=Streptomyces sp. NPDC097640 TaxID=3157229 RepID=UPI00332E78EF